VRERDSLIKWSQIESHWRVFRNRYDHTDAVFLTIR